LSLWDWAVSTYERPGVADACLALQDRYGQNVSFLLWAIWASPEEAALKQGAKLARDWDQAVLSPLRGVRRALKTPPFKDDSLRETVKAAELDAERLLLLALSKLAAPVDGDALEALTAASTAWGAGAAAPRAPLQRLAAAVVS
jgi:uncharacterized protein (TIGR02444 family)